MKGGHGWVYPRIDGAKARCGGPPICAECKREQAQKNEDDAQAKEPPKLLQPFQQRVVDELAEVSERLANLVIFSKSSTFLSLPLAEQGRLMKQMDIMASYMTILTERIKAFT